MNQTFPLNLVDVIIEKVESFHVIAHDIEPMLSQSLEDLHVIFDEQYQIQDLEQEDMPMSKQNNTFELADHHYKAIYRVVFLFRILAKLSEKYLLENLESILHKFIQVVKESVKCDYKSLLYIPNEKDDEKLVFLKKEFNFAYQIVTKTFPKFTKSYGPTLEPMNH